MSVDSMPSTKSTVGLTNTVLCVELPVNETYKNQRLDAFGHIWRTEEWILEIIGPNLDLQKLLDEGRRNEYKTAYYINERLDEIREKITGKPEKVSKEWWK